MKRQCVDWALTEVARIAAGPPTRHVYPYSDSPPFAIHGTLRRDRIGA